MVLNPEKCYCMTFRLNNTKNEFVLEDDAIAPSRACSITNNDRFQLGFLFPFEAIMQKGCE